MSLRPFSPVGRTRSVQAAHASRMSSMGMMHPHHGNILHVNAVRGLSPRSALFTCARQCKLANRIPSHAIRPGTFIIPRVIGWVVPVKIVRRVGVSPRERGSASGQTCPDIFELADGNFAVIGREATKELDAELPPDARRADYERIVVITRETLVRAKADIPDA